MTQGLPSWFGCVPPTIRDPSWSRLSLVQGFWLDLRVRPIRHVGVQGSTRTDARECRSLKQGEWRSHLSLKSCQVPGHDGIDPMLWHATPWCRARSGKGPCGQYLSGSSQFSAAGLRRTCGPLHLKRPYPGLVLRPFGWQPPTWGVKVPIR